MRWWMMGLLGLTAGIFFLAGHGSWGVLAWGHGHVTSMMGPPIEG